MVEAIILCLDEADLVKESVWRLRKDCDKIIVVDNGSSEEQKEILRGIKDITLVDLPENKGISNGRNAGLAVSTREYVFLLDGDILYVPGSIPKLLKAIKKLPDAGCVGCHNPLFSAGVQQREQANAFFPQNTKLWSDFPMAWTQYGLFRGNLLREIGFVTEGVFGEAGIGYEDDWLYQEFLARGFKSYYLEGLIYYHERHGGARWLKKMGLPIRDEERKKAFKDKWNCSTWIEVPLYTTEHRNEYAKLGLIKHLRN